MDNAFELLKIMASFNNYVHFEVLGMFARDKGLELTDRQVLHILTTDPRFRRIDTGVYYIKGKNPGKRLSEEELEAL